MSTVIPVVFSFDKRILLGASVSIKSLIDSAKEDTIYDIRIFHSDLDLATQRNLSGLIQNTKHNMVFHYVNPNIFKDAPKSKGSWTEIVYYRFLTSQLLPEYSKAIYSDVDVLFKNDLTDLYEENIEGFEFAAVRAEKNSPNNIGHKYFEQNTNEFVFWSGLLLINCEEFRNGKIFEKLLSNAKIFHKELKFFDLDLVNITCKKIKEVSLKYCVLQSLFYKKDFKEAQEYEYLKHVYTDTEISEVVTAPTIIHYAGKPGKPWRMKNPYPDYKEYMDKLPPSLKKFTLRDIRKRLFSKV